MSEIADTVNEAVEKGSESRLNAIIAALVATTATFMALCNVKGGNVVVAMQHAQSQAVDAWNLYQAKSTKQYLADSVADELAAQRDLQPALAAGPRGALEQKLADYSARVKRYDGEKEEARQKGEGFEKDYERLEVRHDQFDMAEAGMSLGIALFGLTALTRKRWLLVVALAFAGFGVVLGVAGFAGLSLHPEWLAKLLG
jgi:hypothetical protein